MLSCSIATLGLITNSSAVIIGAMLVAPLMSPILGLSIATVVAEGKLFRRALVALGAGILLALLLSTLLGWIARLLPFDVLVSFPDEVLSRTHPTPFDLGIALAGGAAAAYALAQPRLSAALPGVAIATALMPLFVHPASGSLPITGKSPWVPCSYLSPTWLPSHLQASWFS